MSERDFQCFITVARDQNEVAKALRLKFKMVRRAGSSSTTKIVAGLATGRTAALSDRFVIGN
jgi:hypothetical protein